jgi:deoxyribonuclease-4
MSSSKRTKLNLQNKHHSRSNTKKHSKNINLQKTSQKQSSQHQQKQQQSNPLNLIIGCHASITPSVLEGIRYAHSIGANAAQIFLGSNRQASIKSKTHLTPEDIREIRQFLKQSGMYLIIHSIYLLNLCKAPPTSGRVKWMHDNILHDMKYGAILGANIVVLHLGSRLDMPVEEALDNLIANINYIVAHAPSGIKLSLETAAGSGSQVGYTLEELWFWITSRLYFRRTIANLEWYTASWSF